jgi:anti-repressor protein
MSDIRIFNHPQFGAIRTAGTPDYPEFCAMDLCRALGYKNGRDAVAKHVDYRDVAKRDTPTKNQYGTEVIQQITYVNESGMYALAMASKLDSAKEFRHWVTSEVLPSIRKHGAYMTDITIDSILADPDNAIRLLQTLKEERQQRQLAESKAALLEEVTREQAPKVLFAEAITGSQTNILVRDLAKLIQQNGYNIGEKRLFQWLRDNGYLCTYGQNYNKPMQRYVEQGLFFVKEGSHSENGVLKSNFTTLVTGKGQQYFINKFIQN